MGCHCSEISIISSDLGVIKSAISKLGDITTSSEEISKSISDYAGIFNDNIDITNKENVISALKDLNRDEPRALLNSVQECTSYEISLKSKLESLKISDRHYHEEQRRKHNHDD